MSRLGPLPLAPGVAKVRLLMTWNGRPAYNIFNMKYAGVAPLSADCASAATQIRAAWNTNVAPLISNQVSLGVIEVTDLSSRTGGIGVNNVASLGTKSVATPAPANVAMCVSFTVNYRFRGGHARIYLPGQDTSTITGGNTWAGATVTASANAMHNFVLALKAISVGGSSWIPTMLSYYTHDSAGNPIYHPEGPHDYPIQDAVVHTRVDSQRRRLGKETA
jgi:hypothetical protein